MFHNFEKVGADINKQCRNNVKDGHLQCPTMAKPPSPLVEIGLRLLALTFPYLNTKLPL